MRTRQQFGVAVLAAALALLLCGVGQARAGLIVLPNANTNVSGNDSQFLVLDNGDVTLQWVHATSQLTSVVGDQITSIGFRLPTPAATVTSALSYSSFNPQLGKSLNPPGSLSSTFADNQGPDTTTVLSGPLTIPATPSSASATRIRSSTSPSPPPNSTPAATCCSPSAIRKSRAQSSMSMRTPWQPPQ
jgi:hypothetical protein